MDDADNSNPSTLPPAPAGSDNKSPTMANHRSAKYAAMFGSTNPPIALTEDPKGKGPATKKPPPPPTDRSVTLTIDQSPLQAAAAKTTPPPAAGVTKRKTVDPNGAHPKKICLGFECYTTDSISRGPLNVLKWADIVVPPKDTTTMEGLSDEKLLERAALYTYRVSTSAFPNFINKFDSHHTVDHSLPRRP